LGAADAIGEQRLKKGLGHALRTEAGGRRSEVRVVHVDERDKALMRHDKRAGEWVLDHSTGRKPMVSAGATMGFRLRLG
jgi:hypothetical protein